jgi:hypothetical protein
MSTQEVQRQLRHKQIILTNVPSNPLDFDATGLRELKNLDAKIEIQDQSIDANDGNFSHQLCVGTLRQLLEAAHSEDGPILNALSFPFSLDGVVHSPLSRELEALSSEIEAWRLTEGIEFCNDKATFPTGDMRWGLCGTSGARHWIHIDSDGLGTFVDMRCGGNWWIIFTPPDGDKYALASIDQFLGNFDITRVPDQWVVEAVYLTPSTRL